MSDTPTSKPQQQQSEPPPAIIPIASPSGMLIANNVVNTPRTSSSPRQSPRQSPRPIKSPAVSISSIRRQNSATSMKSLTRFPAVPKLDSSGGTTTTATGTTTAASSSTAAAASTPYATTGSTYSTTFKSVETEKNLQTDPIEHALKIQGVLPTPMDSTACPLFCCFYAEFDNIVGPKICFQSPPNFMEKDISTPTEHIHRLLEETFQTIQNNGKQKEVSCGTGEKVASSEPTFNSKRSSTSTLEGEAVDDDVNNLEDQVDDDDEEEIYDPLQQQQQQQQDPEKSLSIFDSSSEYIITGKELAGKMISLSTHHMHILTRPTVIINERYERNALLFCVGFVLRRAEDPRPFHPLLSKWATALRSVEVESQFLTKQESRIKIQKLLDKLLMSLNSRSGECNILLDSANMLNLKLFRPPKPPAKPVKDYDVPILLRQNWQIQNCDWDLAINWVVMRIDGVNHTRWISTKSEVDMELTRACLRVLKHHGVIALVDMFFYSNRYESTEMAARMLSGKEPKLLQAALDFVAHHKHLDPGNDSIHSGSNLHLISPVSTPVATSYPPPSSSFPKVESVSPSQERSDNYRQEQRDMKAALGELYCSCNRTMSFGEMWVKKTSETKNAHFASSVKVKKNADPRGGENRHTGRSTQGYRPGSRSLESNPGRNYMRQRYSSYPVEPQGETNQEENKKNSIDWKSAFGYFDLRRFATFGIVHGLLRRVHSFPLVLDECGNTMVDSTNTHSLPVLDLGGSTVHHPEFGRLSMRHSSKPFEHKRATSEAELTHFVAEVASAMDGTRCDDELVCMFEKPFEKLVELVQTVGNKRIMFSYATGD